MKNVFKTMAFTLLGLVLSVNLAWAVDTYVKVTSTSDLKIGDEYAIVTGSTYALTTEMNGSNGLKFAAATVNKDQSITLPSKGASFKLGGTEGAYTLSDDNGYFSANGTGNKSRYLSTKSTSGESEFAISFNATSGSLTLTTQQSTARTLKANSTTDARFYSTNSGNVVYLYKKKVDTPAYTITAQSNNTTFGTVSLSGSVITASPKEGYRYANPAYTVTSGTATVEQDGNEFTVTPTANCTIRINFEAIPKHKVYWSQNGDKSKYDEVAEGADITFPETAEGCDGKTFMGWVGETDKNYQSDKTAPTYITSATMGKQDITYYAVFADKKGDGGSVTITNDDIKNSSLGGSYAEKTITVGTYTFTVQACKMNDKLQMRDHATLSFIQIPELPGAITNISSSACSNSASPEGNYTGILHFKSAKTRGNANTDDIDRIDCSSGVTSINWDVNNTGKAKSGYLLTSAGLRLYDLTISYGDVEISNYTTTCAPTYEATVATGITNGSVVISKTDDAAAGAASLTGLKQGDKVYIFPTANTGYKLDAVTVNETPISAQSGKYSYTIGEAGITVSATFAPATYQITYDLDDGAWVNESQVAKTYTYGIGATLPTADDVIKANNTFEGWYSEEKSAIITSIGTTETGNKSLTAIWTPASARTVTIDGDSRLSYTSLKPTVVDKDAESLTVTYSVNKGYTISAVAVTVNDAALIADEVVFNDEQLTITPTAGFTGNVSITFTVVEKMFTVTWMANKTQFKQEQIQEGSKVTLPAGTPEDVISGEDTYKFQGWFTEEQYSNETTAPAYITNNTIEPAGDVTYYAVYAIEEKTPSTTTYTRVTEESQLQTASSLVIVNNSASKLFTNALGTATAPTESNGEITVNNTDMWSLSYANSKYTISNASGTLGAATMPAKSSGNYNKPMSITTSNNSWTIAESGTDLFVLKNANNVGIEYYSSNWVVYINDNIAGVEACAHKLYIPKMINTTKNYRTRVAIIDHIEVSGTPKETNFVAGETFDATGLSIDVHYQGEDNPTNVTEGFTYAPNGTLATSNDKITFTYQGKTADVAISVSNTVSGIEVTTDPTKMEYTEGEQFNPAGMVVTATYDNSAERDVTGYDYEPKGDLALGDVITISFGGQTTELGITINEATKTTVNWFVEGAPYTAGNPSTAVIPGKKITVLPTEPEACQGNQFVGWTAVDANYYNATTAPTDMFKTLAEVPTIGSETTNFYAVFASEAVGTYDEKVTLTALDAPTADKFTYAFANPSGTKPSWVPSASEARAYVNNTLTVTSKNSRIITKIEYTYNINKNDKGTAPTGATVIGNNSDNGSWDATSKTWTSSTNAATTVTLTVNGSAGNYGFTAIKVYLTGGTVLSDYSTTCLTALANPTITTAEGEYCGSVDVEITQPAGNPEGAKIMYSTDNETWNEYTAAVNITTSGTVYAKVVKDPKQTDVVSATYTVYPEYTLAQAATAATDASQMACLTFSDLLVQARSLGEAFLKASDGQIVLLNKSSHGLSVGDKLVANDAHVTFVKAHDLLQLTSTEGIAAATTGNATTPEEKAITALAAADYGQLVKIMNVTYDATNKKFTDASSNEIAVDAKFFPSGIPTSWPDGGKFNVTGIVLTNGENVVIAPRNTDDLESLATPLDKPTNFAVASVNSYRASYTWTAVENNVGYTLYIYDGDNEIYKSSKIGSTIETYAPQKDLEAGHTYTAKLVALGDKVEHSDSPAAEVGFTTNPNAKLNWYVGGSFYQTTDASQEKVVTPEDPESPCATNYENFVTWYTEEFDGQLTALDAAKKVKAGDAAASQAGFAKEYNFYAVFGKIKTQGTDKYVKVTEAQDNWKGEYLIGYDEGDDKESLTVFDGSLTTLDAKNNYQTVLFEDDGSIKATETINGYRFIFTKSATTKDAEENDVVYYNIQSASGYYIGDPSGKDNGILTSETTKYNQYVLWDATYNKGVEISGESRYLSFNTASDQMRFRYMSSDKGNLILYKRITTNPQYSGYITTCPQTYTITIAENTKGLVEAATTTEILKGAKVLLTATAYDGYTKTGGNWIVKNTTTGDVVDGLVGNTNYLTMPDYDVTIDYNFQEIKDQFVDNLHGNTIIEKGGANYELPVLADFSETTGKPSDAFTKFIGWSATSYDSGEPATEQPTILEGEQTATGATYVAVWYNGSGKYITEYCQTSAPANLHLVAAYHKATSVRIDWDNVTGADKYHIIVMDGEANIIANADVTESLYDLSGLTPGATYICTVKAHKDCWSDETEEFEFTTKENIQSYAVTINAEGGTYTIDPELVEGKIQEGATVMITNIAPTDDAHYFFKELTVPEATDLVEVEGSYMFTMPGKAVTINIVFAEYPKVTWKMEGAADQTSIAVRQDNKFVVGTVHSAPENWKYKNHFTEFAGWVTADKCDAEGNVTTAEFISATTEVPATGLTVYGAVAKSAKADLTQTTKVVADANIKADAIYVIGAAQSSSEETMYYLYAVDGDKNWGRMATADDETNSPMLLTAEVVTGGFALKNAAGLYIQGTTAKSKFPAMTTTAAALTLSTTATDESAIHHIYNSSTFYMRHNYGATYGMRWYDGTGTGTPAYLYKVGLTYDKLTINPQPDYGRTDLVVGNYGTVCVPYAVKTTDRSGATFWSIETSDAIGYTNPTSVTIVQEEGKLEAGKPYIFCATDTKMALFFSDDKYEGTESVEANGLYGNLTDGTITINDSSDPNAGSEPTRGYFFVLQQKLYECGWNCTVGPNRGWVQAAAIEDETTPSPAPRRVIGNPNGTPTGINNLNADGFKNIEGAHKYFHNNNIVIVNEGRIYNAQGIEVQ